MDEIFGEDNFLAKITWQGMDTIKNDALYFSTNCENILVFSKDITRVRIIGIPKTEKQHRHYKNYDNDPRGEYLLTPLHAKSGSEANVYEFTFPNGQKWSPPSGTYPRYSIATLRELVDQGRLYLDSEGVKIPQRKTYWAESNPRMRPSTFWNYESFGSTRRANAELREIIGRGQFENSKPAELISACIDIVTSPNDLILDSFAGSGTTAQAVLALNKVDDGNRRFILVECEEYADSITAERVRRVIRGVPAARDAALREGLGGSFTYCTLGEPIDIEKMLTGESLPPFASLAAYLLHTASGLSAGEAALQPQNDDGLFHTAGSTDYYLVYEPDIDWLRTDAAMLDEDRAKRIAAACETRGSRAVVFAAGQYMGQRALSRLRITFCRLPYELHRAV